MIDDEKWIYYANLVNKKQWLSRNRDHLSAYKLEIDRKKVTLSIWWDHKGIIYYEFLEPNKTITADRYSHQPRRFSQALERKGKRKVILLHDNATIESLG